MSKHEGHSTYRSKWEDSHINTCYMHKHTHAHSLIKPPWQEVISTTPQDVIMISNAVELHCANKGMLLVSVSN